MLTNFLQEENEFKSLAIKHGFNICSGSIESIQLICNYGKTKIKVPLWTICIWKNFTLNEILLMKPNKKFYDFLPYNERRCPLCGNHHSVTKTTREPNRQHFKTIYQYNMYCFQEKQNLLYESFFEREINEIFFQKTNVIKQDTGNPDNIPDLFN